MLRADTNDEEEKKSFQNIVLQNKIQAKVFRMTHFWITDPEFLFQSCLNVLWIAFYTFLILGAYTSQDAGGRHNPI